MCQAVIIGERQRHDQPGDELSFHKTRLQVGAGNAKDGDFGEADDWQANQSTRHAKVGKRDGTIHNLVGLELLSA